MKKRKSLHKDSDKDLNTEQLMGAVNHTKVGENIVGTLIDLPKEASPSCEVRYPVHKVKFTNPAVINESISPLVARLSEEYAERLSTSRNLKETIDTLNDFQNKLSDVTTSLKLLKNSLCDADKQLSGRLFSSCADLKNNDDLNGDVK